MFKKISYISVSGNFIKENINISEEEMIKKFGDPIKTEYSNIYGWSFISEEDDMVKHTVYTSDEGKKLNLISNSAEEDIDIFLERVGIE